MRSREMRRRSTITESNKGHQDERMAAASGFGRWRLVIVQACVDQRRDPRRGSEGGGEVQGGGEGGKNKNFAASVSFENVAVGL